MSVESTRDVIRRYLEEHSSEALREDAVFTIVGSGQEFCGRQAIADMLQGFYHGIFEARAEERRLLVGDGHAVLEADVVGELREPLAGITPRSDVRVPICVVYDVADGAIAGARVYLETDCLR